LLGLSRKLGQDISRKALLVFRPEAFRFGTIFPNLLMGILKVLHEGLVEASHVADSDPDRRIQGPPVARWLIYGQSVKGLIVSAVEFFSLINDDWNDRESTIFDSVGTLMSFARRPNLLLKRLAGDQWRLIRYLMF
jgi:hypothetical protein